MVFGNGADKSSSRPFAIIENKETGNVARIGYYYKYSTVYGNKSIINDVERNYQVLVEALKSINQQELANAITEVKSRINNYTKDTGKAINGVEYGTIHDSNYYDLELDRGLKNLYNR